MNKYLTWNLLLLSLLCSTFLVSCIHDTEDDMSIRELGKIQYGEEYNTGIMNSKEHIDKIQLMDNNDSITVYVYRDIKWERPTVLLKGEFGYNVIGYELCAAAFRNNRVFYWGSVDDFKKNDVPLIQSIGEQISERFTNGDKKL